MLSTETRILVVDDSKLARSWLIGMLAELGYKNIVQASNGHEALQLLAKNHGGPNAVGLVISDGNMPEMDGYELLTFIRQKSVVPQLPFFIISAFADNGVRLDAIERGVSGFMQKPYTVETLKSLLGKIA